MQVYAEQQRAVVASLPSVAEGDFFETQPFGEATVDLEAMDADEGAFCSVAPLRHILLPGNHGALPECSA